MVRGCLKLLERHHMGIRVYFASDAVLPLAVQSAAQEMSEQS